MTYAELDGDTMGEPSAAIRARVFAARSRQASRFSGSGVRVNARMTARQTRLACRVPPEAARLLGLAVSRLGLSARAYHRVLRVARTVADLAGCETIAAEHVSEALQYRGVDRGL